MKPLLLTLTLAVAGATTASAQIYQPTVVRDSVIGAVAGALVGGHNHDHWAQGAAIGAAAGALVGATVDQPRTVVYRPAPVVADAPRVADAPMVGATTTQVVYVQTPPRVVYVDACPPPPVYYSPAPVIVAASWHSGPYWRSYPRRSYYRGPVSYHHSGHRGPDHHDGGHHH